MIAEIDVVLGFDHSFNMDLLIQYSNQLQHLLPNHFSIFQILSLSHKYVLV